MTVKDERSSNASSMEGRASRKRCITGVMVNNGSLYYFSHHWRCARVLSTVAVRMVKEEVLAIVDFRYFH